MLLLPGAFLHLLEEVVFLGKDSHWLVLFQREARVL